MNNLYISCKINFNVYSKKILGQKKIIVDPIIARGL